jgi:hypothetical protein
MGSWNRRIWSSPDGFHLDGGIQPEVMRFEEER